MCRDLNWIPMSSNLETQDFYQDHRKLATCHSTQVKKKWKKIRKKKDNQSNIICHFSDYKFTLGPCILNLLGAKVTGFYRPQINLERKSFFPEKLSSSHREWMITNLSSVGLMCVLDQSWLSSKVYSEVIMPLYQISTFPISIR